MKIEFRTPIHFGKGEPKIYTLVERAAKAGKDSEAVKEVGAARRKLGNALNKLARIALDKEENTKNENT